MTAEELIIGNKYVPFQKTIGDDFNSSRFVREGLDFLYYIGTNDEGKHMFTVRETSHSGAIYNPEDVYEYIEEHNGIRRGMAVVIQCSLETYSTYTTMFKQLGFINKERNELWSNGTEGVVFAISKASSGTVILGVRDSYRNECLINASGVRLVDDVVDTKPTKWAIKVNPYNKQALTDWRGLRIDSTDGYLICDTPQDRPHSLPHNRGYYVMDLNDYPEYTLITDEQFYNQIINKPQTMPQETPQETMQYPKTPEGLYDMQFDMLNLKVGNIVKVTHKVPSHYMGWENSWSDDMDSLIGQEHMVDYISSGHYGIRLKGSAYSFPPYALEFVRDEAPKKIVSYSFGINEPITGSMETGGEIITFEKPIDRLTGSDVKWLVQLLKDAEVNTRYDVERISRM